VRPRTHDRAAVASPARDVGAPEPVAAVLADHLADQGVLTRTAHGYALPEHAAAASDARRARADAVVAALAAEPFAPPDLDEVTRTHGLDHRERAALVASGAVVRRQGGIRRLGVRTGRGAPVRSQRKSWCTSSC
jgi:hypothetical protein